MHLRVSNGLNKAERTANTSTFIVLAAQVTIFDIMYMMSRYAEAKSHHWLRPLQLLSVLCDQE
jgi:hypothetical protein